jgi:glutathione S-transferase
LIELYHHGSSVCAAKVRLALAEKGVTVDRYHYIDILKGEQFTADYLAINSKGVVPAFVHDGRIINESTLICEYVDESFAGPALQPSDAYARYETRTWTKAVDELLHPACAEVTYVSCHRHIVNQLSPAERDAFLNNTPERSVKGAWRQRKRELVELGFDAPGVDVYFRLYDDYLARMESALTNGPWLVGDSLTLADIAMAPYVNRMFMLGMSQLWAGGRRPHVENWFGRMRARPTFAPTLTDCCPPQLTVDLLKYGTLSWPGVQAILAAGGGVERGTAAR